MGFHIICPPKENLSPKKNRVVIEDRAGSGKGKLKTSCPHTGGLNGMEVDKGNWCNTKRARDPVSSQGKKEVKFRKLMNFDTKLAVTEVKDGATEESKLVLSAQAVEQPRRNK